MLWFFTPYSQDMKLFEAWDQYMNLVSDPEDWVCMMDGDILFLHADFGHQIQEYLSLYPDTGLFTCYSSRSRTPWMMPERNIFHSPSIAEHKKMADYLRRVCGTSVKEINDRVTGHLLVIKKSTWEKIRENVKERCVNLKILSVDTAISHAVIDAGLRIRLMKGVYVLHYYRFVEGANYKGHLK